MLTGKAKEDFEKWYSDTDSEIKHSLQKSLFYSKPYIERYAYYLEWLDSVGIHLCIGRYGYTINTDYLRESKKVDGDRQFITGIAIEQANKIYNER